MKSLSIGLQAVDALPRAPPHGKRPVGALAMSRNPLDKSRKYFLGVVDSRREENLGSIDDEIKV